MRTITTNQTAALTSMYKTYRARVWFDATGTGSYVDMTNYLGFDWLRDIQISESIDQNVATATIKLSRAQYDISLSPFMGNSKANDGTPVVYPGRKMYIETATIGYGLPVQSTDWVQVFMGYVDSVDPHDLEIEVQCRDLGALLVDTFIEMQRIYAASGSVAMETVIQQILDDNINTPGLGSVTLYIPTSPTYLLTEFTQQKQSVMDAISQITQLIGWDVRYKWNSGTNSYALTLWTPNRSATTPVYTFGPDDYYTTDQIAIDRANIRNVVGCYYPDSASGLNAYAVASDSTSISTYGRRYYEVTQGATSQINSVAAADLFCAACLSDLSFPLIEHGVTSDYFFAAELGDLYQYNPNFKVYDSAQKLAVIGITHDLNADGTFHTTLLTRGKPATGYRRWLRNEARPGVAPGANFIDPNTPSATIAAALGSVIVTYTPDNPAKWGATYVYMSTTASDVADPGQDGSGKNKPISESFLVAVGKQTSFTITALIPTTTYFCRLQITDTDGNYSAVSGLQTVYTQAVGPYHSNLAGVGAILNPNCDFNIYTNTDTSGLPAGFPDSWGETGPTGWSSTTTYYSTDAASGLYSILMNLGVTAGGVGIQSQSSVLTSQGFVPFAAGDIITAGCWLKWTATLPSGVTSLVALGGVNWYNADKGLLGHDTITFGFAETVSAPGLDTWYGDGNFVAAAPANTRYFGLAFYDYGYNGGTDGWGGSSATVVPGLYLDRFTARRGLPQVAVNFASYASGSYFTPIAHTDNQLTTYVSGYAQAVAGFAVPTDTAAAEWTCIIPGSMTVTYTSQLSLSAFNVTGNLWIAYFDPVASTWSIANLVPFNGGNGTFAITISAQVQMVSGSRVRAELELSDDSLIPVNSIVFTIACTNRSDLT